MVVKNLVGRVPSCGAVMLTVLNYLSGFQICALLSAVNLILNLVIIYTGDVRPASTVDIATAYTKRQLIKFSTRDMSSM